MGSFYNRCCERHPASKIKTPRIGHSISGETFATEVANFTALACLNAVVVVRGGFSIVLLEIFPGPLGDGDR